METCSSVCTLGAGYSDGCNGGEVVDVFRYLVDYGLPDEVRCINTMGDQCLGLTWTPQQDSWLGHLVVNLSPLPLPLPVNPPGVSPVQAPVLLAPPTSAHDLALMVPAPFAPGRHAYPTLLLTTPT